MAPFLLVIVGMGTTIPFFINLDAFYGLHPELREDQGFQDFLSEINTGKTGFKDNGYGVDFKPEQILDAQETARLLGSDLTPRSKGTTLWNYVAQKVDGDLLKEAVQKRYFKTAQVTGNIFADLKTEIDASLPDIKKYEEPTANGIVCFERSYTSLDLIIDLQLDENNRPLYKYYASIMNITPEQLHLLLIRVFGGDIGRGMDTYARFTFSDTDRENEWFRLQSLTDQLENSVENPPEAIPQSQETPSISVPDWMCEVGVPNVGKFIETQIFDFYKSLIGVSSEDFNSLLERQRVALAKVGCGENFIDNLLSFTPVPEGNLGSATQPADQIKEKIVQFLNMNGYQIFGLSYWVDGGNDLFLGKASKTYSYSGIATRPQQFSEYQILKTDNKPRQIRADFEITNLDKNTAAVFQLIDFQPELLGPLTQSEEGKKIVEKVFGRPPQMSRDILFEFSKNLQKSIFLLESAEGQSGETDDIERSNQALIMALGMSSSPEQLFLYLYVTSFNLFKDFKPLRRILSELMKKMALPGDCHATDDGIVIEESKPVLDTLATQEDYYSPETIKRLSKFFDEETQNVGLSENEPSYSARQAIMDVCQEIVQKNPVLAEPDIYFTLTQNELEPIQFKPPRPSKEALSPGIPIVWFEKAAERLGLSADDFKHIDISQDGQLSLHELKNFEWNPSQRTIFAAVAKKHALAITRFLILAEKENESPNIPLDILTKGQARILLRNNKYNLGIIRLAGEKIPLTTLRRANHADRKEDYQDTVQTLQSRYSHRAARFYNQMNQTDVELIQKMTKVFDGKADDATKARKAHDLILKEKYLLTPNVVIYTSTKISSLNLTDSQLNEFFEGLASNAEEMISFTAFGKTPSVATFYRMIQEPELYSCLMQLFHGVVPVEKPAWFDNLWAAFAINPNNIKGMLSVLSKGLDYEWVRQAFIQAAGYQYWNNFSPFMDFLRSADDQKIPLDGMIKFYSFSWAHFQELGLERDDILWGFNYDLNSVYHNSLRENDNLRATILISILEKILNSTPDAELIPILEGTRFNPESSLFFTAVILSQDTAKTRSGALYKSLWMQGINGDDDGTNWQLHYQMNWLFTQIGIVGEIKIEELYARLNLGDAEIRQSNQTLGGLLVDTKLLDADFKAVDIYFRQMETQDNEDKLGARYIGANDMEDHLQKLSYIMETFLYDMALAIKLVVNPKSPQEEQAKRTQLLDHIDRWLAETPSQYMKTVLLALRWQLDTSTDLKAAYDLRARFAHDDSSLPAFDRKYYDMFYGWPNSELTGWLDSKNPPKALNPENNSHKNVPITEAHVLFFENEPPDGTNHASVVKSVFESNSLKAFGGKASGSGNVVNRVYETLNQLNFDQLSARVISFSFNDFTNEISSLSKKDAKKILASLEGIKLKEKLEELNRKGVVVVASAGNDGENFSTSVLNQLSILSLFSPPLCLVTAAGANNGGIANYSSQGSYDIRPTITGYSHMDGTSFSGPAVASIATKMSQIPSELTGEQKVLIMMMATQKLPGESRMSQGAGLGNESRSLWLTYYFSAPHTEEELNAKAQELGLGSEMNWLKYLVKQHGDDLLQNPDKLWHKLLFK